MSLPAWMSAILIVAVLSAPLAFAGLRANSNSMMLVDLHNSLQKCKEVQCASFDSNKTGCVSDRLCKWSDIDEKCSADRSARQREALVLMGIFVGYSAASIGFVYLSIKCLSYFIGDQPVGNVRNAMLWRAAAAA